MKKAQKLSKEELSIIKGATSQALKVMEVLGSSSSPLTVNQVASRVGVSVEVAQAYLETLVDHVAVEKSYADQHQRIEEYRLLTQSRLTDASFVQSYLYSSPVFWGRVNNEVAHRISELSFKIIPFVSGEFSKVFHAATVQRGKF